jgi:hypothetical protein
MFKGGEQPGKFLAEGAEGAEEGWLGRERRGGTRKWTRMDANGGGGGFLARLAREWMERSGIRIRRREIAAAWFGVRREARYAGATPLCFETRANSDLP